MFFFQEGFTYRNFLMDVLGIFFFVVWFWLLIVVFSDLFRRHDISGWIKAIWVIALIFFSYLAILAYLIFQGRGMAERNVQQAQQARDELRRVVGFSVADEIQKLDGLKKAGSISDAEFARLRARLVSDGRGPFTGPRQLFCRFARWIVTTTRQNGRQCKKQWTSANFAGSE